MKALAIDTATTALGLCLRVGSESRTVVLQIGLKHSEKLMPAVRNLLQEADLPVQGLDLIVCSIGPGSFTGIRIGLATAKGLAAGVRAAGTNCRLVGVSTLDGLAYRYRRFPGSVVAVNPSLRKKHYAAIYKKGTRVGEYLETTLEDLSSALESQRPLLMTGAGACDLYQLLATDEAGAQRIVDASQLCCDPAGLLACALEHTAAERGGDEQRSEVLAEPVPLYLRKSEAEITFFGE